MRPWLFLPLLALLAGCTASPPPQFFTLGPVPGRTHSIHEAGIELRRIGLAGYLDRNSIVLSAANYRLKLAADQRWAEPLGPMLDRVLSEDLGQRLPDTPVFTEAGAIGGAATLILEVNIQRLDADSDGTLVLQAQIALRRDRPRTRSIRLTARPADTSTEAIVAAMSTLVGELADRVADLVESK